MKNLPFFAFILFSFAACTSPKKNSLSHSTLQATLWVQNSAEYQAMTSMAYQTAATYLEQALNDETWVAELTQEGKELTGLPSAVVLDIDETVLDNSPFQARMIEQNSEYNSEEWEKWVREGQADAVPGAVAFTNAANDLGITVIYLSNRNADTEAETRENLKTLGFPISEETDVVLLKGEQENWTSAKTARRAYVAENFRIVMLFGDDFNDFLPAKNITEEERNNLLDEHRANFGKKWFILPNPIYGSWNDAMFNFDRSLTPEQKEAAIKAHLHTKQ